MTASETKHATTHVCQDLDAFVRRVKPSLERYISKRVRNQDHAEEIVSRVFEALARTWGSFRGEIPGDAYALFVAANALKNYYARDLQKLKRQISLEEWIESYNLQHGASHVCLTKQVESQAWASALMSEIEVCCSKVEAGVIGMYYQGQTFDEISRLIGMNAATVRGHFLRGRRKLLVHLFRNAPQFFGGEDALPIALIKLQADQPGLLSPQELNAVSTRSGPEEVLRNAMVKLGPYLGGVG